MIHPSIHRLYDYDQKTYLSVRIHIIENEDADGRNEYMDIAKEANLIWHQIVNQNLNTRLKLTAEHS